MPAIIDKLLRIGEGKILRQLEAVSRAVNAIEDDFVAMTDDELRAQTVEFKERLAAGESLDDLMPEAFATVKAIPGIEAIYQMHKNLVAPDSNTSPEKIANLEEKCAGNYLKLSVDANGKKYTVSNPSTKHEKTYTTKS